MAGGGVSFVPGYIDDEFKPYKGRCFSSLVDAEEFYRIYASAVGFDCRCYGLKTVGGVNIWRYMVCSRAGTKFVAKHNIGECCDDVENRRKRLSNRCECMARISFKFDSEFGYVVHDFVEEHNHALVESKYKHFMKVNRNVDNIHRKFVLDCAKVSIGPTHAHNLLAELLGGVENVGCTLLDVRNFSRDMKVFVNGSDAQMLLDEMKRKKDLCDGFVYSYEVDDEQRLNRLFWCDSLGRRSYHSFGDVVAFDTTYYTNKYCMIFAPFTGKDNHGRPITFAAGLLSKEDAESFCWLFQKFIECMGTMPSLIITDQDLGMKVAVERVLIGTRHRWCMWHIMLKLADKVSKALHANESFKKDLNCCVWSELIEPHVFEELWDGIMKKYGLESEQWFITMFAARIYWVPAFFRDYPMSGLLRTTSISESENSFFKRYTRSTANLIEFWMQYNHALDAQRYGLDKLNYVDSSNMPSFTTKLNIERHAASLYTLNIFRQVQGEIASACFDCILVVMHALDGIHEFVVKDLSGQEFKVVHDRGEDTYVCSCKMFVRIGLICCHIFYILKNNRVTAIPEKYICDRWLKLSCAKAIHGACSGSAGDYPGIDEAKRVSNKLLSSFYGWMQKFEGDINKMVCFMSRMDEAGRFIAGDEFIDEGKSRAFERFYGGLVPEEVSVLPPHAVKTKGSGSRLVSRKEKALRDSNKALRRCAKCNQLGHHDARNCDKIKNLKK